MKNFFSSKEIQTLKALCREYNGNFITARRRYKLRSLVKYGQTFTEKEIKVIKLICRERTNDEIARAMKLSAKRVETIRTGIMSKTRSRNVAGVVKFAIKYSIVALK
jgi:DNA-binding CsgD family transcriptional regulator